MVRGLCAAKIMSKRASSPSGTLIKRVRIEEDASLQQIVVASDGNTANKNALIQTIKRTSAMDAPIMCLQGHSKEILDIKFSPDGSSIASASADKTVLLWNVYGDCKKSAIHSVHPLRSSRRNLGPARAIFTESRSFPPHTVLDKFASRKELPPLSRTPPTPLSSSVAQTTPYSSTTSKLDSVCRIVCLREVPQLTAYCSATVIRKFKGHTGIVNTVDVQHGGAGRGLIVSGSDDGTVRVWQEDSKDEVEVVELGYPITAVKWSADGTNIYIGGVDNDVHVFSLAAHAISYTLRGHTDTITSLSLSPSTSQLLSSGMDSTLHCWNIAPFAPQVNVNNPALHPRLIRSYYGAPAGFEGLLRKASWSAHSTQDSDGGSMVAIGGADRALTVWDSATGEIRYKVSLFSFAQ